MPPLAERDQGEDEAVFSVIAGLEARAANDVRERVDAERAVVKERCADAESPHDELPRGGVQLGRVCPEVRAEGGQCAHQQQGWHDVVLIEHPQLRKSAEVLHKL